MLDSYVSDHREDADGNPAGGASIGTGITINWQNGPLGREPNRRPPNGAFVETIIDIARDRLAYYQGTRFACAENAVAISYLLLALDVLGERTSRREAEGTEGTHAGT